MRELMERLVLLPFSVGCISESSVAVSVQQPRRSKTDRISSPIRTKEEEEEEDEEDEVSLSGEIMKNSFRSLSLPKPDVSNGIQKLFKGFKNFSHIFAYKEELEEEEMDIEIGCPTDVKHVTHIGLDGSATTDPIRGWDNLMSADLFSAPTFSWHHQFDLSMSPQPNHTPDHLVLKASAT